jgi:ribosomal protein S2
MMESLNQTCPTGSRTIETVVTGVDIQKEVVVVSPAEGAGAAVRGTTGIGMVVMTAETERTIGGTVVNSATIVTRSETVALGEREEREEIKTTSSNSSINNSNISNINNTSIKEVGRGALQEVDVAMGGSHQEESPRAGAEVIVLTC